MTVAITRTDNVAGTTPSSNVSTHSNVAIGTGNITNRKVVICVTKEVAATVLSSATIDYGSGDVAMSAVIGNALGNNGAYAAHLNLPVGTSATTATIKLTWSGTIANTEYKMAVYTVVSAASALSTSGTDTSTDMDSNDPLTTGSSTIPANGGLLAVASCGTDTTTKTWSNITGDLSEDAGAWRHVTGSSTSAGSATRTLTGTTNGEDGALVWLIFNEDLNTTLTGGHFASDDAFFTSALSLELTGSLYSDLEIFQTAVVTQSLIITGSLFTDTDTLPDNEVVQLDVFYNFLSVFDIAGSLYTDTDTHYTHVLSLDIDVALHTNTNTIETALVSHEITAALFADTDALETAQLDLFLTGVLYADPETFSTHHVREGEFIDGSLFLDTDTFVDNEVVQLDIFYSSTITVGEVHIVFALFGDNEQFYASSFNLPGGIQPFYVVSDDAFYEAEFIQIDIFYRHVTLPVFPATGDFLDEDDIFYTSTTATGAQIIEASLYADTDVLQSHELIQIDIFYTHVFTYDNAITVDLFTNTQSIYTTIVDIGGQLIEGTLYTEADAFFANELIQIDIFYRHVTLPIFPATGDFLDADDVFYTALFQVGNDLPITVGLTTNTTIIYDASVPTDLPIVFAARHMNTVEIYTHVIGDVIQGSLYADTDAFFTATIANADHTIAPARYLNTSEVYTPELVPGTIGIVPSLITNTQTIPVHVALAITPITPALHLNTQTIYTAALTVLPVDISPSLIENLQTFYNEQVSGPEQFIAVGLFTNSPEEYDPLLQQGPALLSFDMNIIRGRLY